MSKKNFKKIDRVKNTIPIEDFVVQYLNDGVLIKCRRLSHKDLKFFSNPYVVSVPFEFASSNIELVFTNKLILVSDRFGNIVPYINPFELKRLERMPIIVEEYEKLKKLKFKLYKLENLWCELQVLLYEKKQIEETLSILRDIKKIKKIEELGGKKYVKEY